MCVELGLFIIELKINNISYRMIKAYFGIKIQDVKINICLKIMAYFFFLLSEISIKIFFFLNITFYNMLIKSKSPKYSINI